MVLQNLSNIGIRDDIHLLQVRRVQVRDAQPRRYFLVQFGVGKGRVVKLVVTPTAVTMQLYEDLLFELLSVLQGQLGGEQDGLGIIGVDVNDGSVGQPRYVGTVPGGPAPVARRGKPDL